MRVVPGFGRPGALRPYPNWERTAIVAVTIYGVCALSFMMVMYALKRRDRRYVAGFAVGCLLSSA